MALRFFDHCLRGVDNGYQNDPIVRYYQMGTNQWRESADWKTVGVLVYSTDVLTEDLMVDGSIHGEVFVSSDREDTDFSIRLCDVYPVSIDLQNMAITFLKGHRIRGSTTIRFSLERRDHLRLAVLDLLGGPVAGCGDGTRGSCDRV